MRKPIVFVQINALSLLASVYLFARGHAVYSLGENFFSPGRKILVFVCRCLARSGILRNAYEHFPALRPYREISAYADRRDLFRKIEPQLADFFHFHRIENLAPNYAMAFKHVAANYVRSNSLMPFVLDEIRNSNDLSGAKIIGIDSDLMFFHRAYFDHSFPDLAEAGAAFRRLFFNFPLFVLAYFFSAAWVMSKIRPWRAAKKEFFMAVDYTNRRDRRGHQLVREITNPDSPILYVFRNREAAKRDGKYFSDIPQCVMGEGSFGLRSGLLALKQASADTWRLGINFLDLAPAHYLQVILLPYRRLRFRALFQSFSVKWFLCRDDYNSDHGLRSQELRAIGAKSAGIMHGIPFDNIIEPSIRYLDYDYYYLFGRHLYDRYYKSTWSKTMVVRAIGPWGLSRADMAKLELPRPKDMIYFSRSGPGEAVVVETIKRLAQLYPAKTFYVKMKPGDGRYSSGDLHSLENLPSNVVMVSPDEDTYAWMLKADYAMGSATTTVAEAIGYGLKTLVFDIHPEWVFYGRDFPGLSVRTSEEAIERFERLEAGTAVFPREKFAGLVAQDVENPFDVIRRDLGLKPNGLPDLERSNESYAHRGQRR